MTAPRLLPSLLVSALLVLALQAAAVPAAAQVSQVTRAVQTCRGAGDDLFGEAVAVVGDVDGDGIQDLAVGAPSSSTRSDTGAVWILLMNADGTARESLEIREGKNGFSFDLDDFDYFGTSVVGLGDLDGDGVPDVGVGARGDDETNLFAGAVYVLYLNPDGTVKADARAPAPVSPTGFTAFGRSLANLGDLDGDGTLELAVGTVETRNGLTNVGSVYLVSLSTAGDIVDYRVVAAGAGGFPPVLAEYDFFGQALAPLGDLDGDGTFELAIGTPGDDTPTGVINSGSVWVVSILPSKALAGAYEIDAQEPLLAGLLDGFDSFGSSVASVGDLDGDGRTELLVGVEQGNATQAFTFGLLLLLSLEDDGELYRVQELHKGLLDWDDVSALGDLIGKSVTLGDLDADGAVEVFCGDGVNNLAGPGCFWSLELCFGPTIDFDATPVAGDVPLTVAFTNLSAGAGTLSVAWDFGDGGASTLTDPVHTYDAPGTYSVTLSVADDADTCRRTAVDLVVVSQPASVTPRNGSGTNPDAFSTADLPVLGTTWDASVDATVAGAGGAAALLAYAAPLGGVPTAFGELLVDPTSDLLAQVVGFVVAGTADFSAPIPADLGLQGLPVHCQAALLSPITLTNALDLVLGV